jgi:hypothetical protein
VVWSQQRQLAVALQGAPADHQSLALIWCLRLTMLDIDAERVTSVSCPEPVIRLCAVQCKRDVSHASG